MKYFYTILFFLIFLNVSHSRNIGETQITTDEGIEVFSNEKYYLLKKNVIIESDKFSLSGDNIKIYFNKDMYDITEIEAVGNVKLKSVVNDINALGSFLLFNTINEEVTIKGLKSKLFTDEFEMSSDGLINVNNKSGNFFINGKNSKLLNEDIIIIGENIKGIFSQENKNKEINYLNVTDKEESYVKSDETDLYAKNIEYNKETSLIELNENVRIIRNGEIVTGDYGTLDTKSNSYKVKSKNTKKVKVIISNSNE